MTDEHKRPASSTIAVVLLWLQGVYFAVFGVWPLISIRTFKLVTGEKTDHLVTGLEADHWLVMTVGLLITSIGLVLILAAWRRRESLEIVFLAMASAISLAAIDFIYVTRSVILPIYLVDGVIEIAFLAGWIAYIVTRSRQFRTTGSRDSSA